MIDKEIQQFWAAYELALGNSDQSLARFLVQVAVEYSYLAGITGPLSLIETDSYEPLGQRRGTSLKTEVERICGTITEARRHATREFALNAFHGLLKRIYNKGLLAAGNSSSLDS